MRRAMATARGSSSTSCASAACPWSDAALQRGKTWLASNQRESGRWFTRSLNGVKQHYISDAASAFAVLALEARE